MTITNPPGRSVGPVAHEPPDSEGLDRNVAEWVEVEACTLPTAERPLRQAAFDDLFASTLSAVERHGETRARLVLTTRGAAPTALAERVQALADAETQCCSFFIFTVTQLPPSAAQADGEPSVALDIEVPSAYADVLSALVERAFTQAPRVQRSQGVQTGRGGDA